MCYADDKIIERRNLKSEIFKYVLYGLALLISLAVILPIVGYYTNKTVDLNIPISLGFLSALLGLFSVKLAYDSITDKIQNANINFLEIIDDLLNDRMNFMYHSYSEEAFSWYLQTHLERADELDKKMIKKKHHNRIIHSISVSLNTLFNRTKWNKLGHHPQGNIKQIYKIVREYDKGKHEEKFNKLLERMGKKSDETEDEFYNRLLPE